jgi:hypothetical protein
MPHLCRGDRLQREKGVVQWDATFARDLADLEAASHLRRVEAELLACRARIEYTVGHSL